MGFLKVLLIVVAALVVVAILFVIGFWVVAIRGMRLYDDFDMNNYANEPEATYYKEPYCIDPESIRPPDVW